MSAGVARMRTNELRPGDRIMLQRRSVIRTITAIGPLDQKTNRHRIDFIGNGISDALTDHEWDVFVTEPRLSEENIRLLESFMTPTPAGEQGHDE